MIIVKLKVVYWWFDDILLELKSYELIKLLIKLIGWIMHLYDEIVDWLIDKKVIWKAISCIEKGVNWLLCIWDELWCVMFDCDGIWKRWLVIVIVIKWGND